MPVTMVKALQAFLDFCYIVQCNVHDTQSLKVLEYSLDHYHQYCEILMTSGVHPNSFNLPCSHAAVHYVHLIWTFGAPNGLCSFITESKHIDVVKELWWWSRHWEMLKEMLTTNSHNDKLAAACVDFGSHGMLEGTVLQDTLHQLSESHPPLHPVRTY